MNANFAEVGLESVYFLHNMGTLALAFVLYLVLMFVAWVFSKMSCFTVKNYGQELSKSLYWGHLTILMFESFSNLAISSFINLKYRGWERFNVGFMSVLTILVLIIVIVYPLAYALFISKNFDYLGWSKFKQKHGAFYE